MKPKSPTRFTINAFILALMALSFVYQKPISKKARVTGVIAHIADCIEMHHQRYERDHAHHQRGERVNQKAHFKFQRTERPCNPPPFLTRSRKTGPLEHLPKPPQRKKEKKRNGGKRYR